MFRRSKVERRDAPKEYGPHKTLYNRWRRWIEIGVFPQIMMGLAVEHDEEQTVMIEATSSKAHPLPSSACLPARERHRDQHGHKKGGVDA